MNRRYVLLSIILVAVCGLNVLAQTGARNRTARRNKQVTVTLVRWPYT